MTDLNLEQDNRLRILLVLFGYYVLGRVYYRQEFEFYLQTKDLRENSARPAFYPLRMGHQTRSMCKYTKNSNLHRLCS